ncbi:MAG: hypothetical protein QM811_17305 [Pirellulales bacterium]
MAEAYAALGRHDDEVRALSSLAVRMPDRRNWELLADVQSRAGQTAAAELSWAESQRLGGAAIDAGQVGITEMAARPMPNLPR